jgi:hypothetical protein
MTAAQSVESLPVRASKNFPWEEFECHDATPTIYPLDWRISRGVPLAAELERVRRHIGAFRPTSVYRTWDYHCAIYAAMRPPQPPPAQSQHLSGRAADITCPAKMEWLAFVAAIKAAANENGSQIRFLKFYRPSPSRGGFAHLDIRLTSRLLVEYET